MLSQVGAAARGGLAWGPDPLPSSWFLRPPPPQGGYHLESLQSVCMMVQALLGDLPCPCQGLKEPHGRVRGQEEGGWEGPGWEAGPHDPASSQRLESLQSACGQPSPHWVSLRSKASLTPGLAGGWCLRLP